MPYSAMLQDVCKASTMRAAAALSQFLKTPIKIDLKPVEINSVDKISLPTYVDKKYIGLFVTINSNLIKGGSSLLLPVQSGYNVCDVLLNRAKGSTEKLDDIEESALKEMMNIVLGNFLTTFAHSLLTASLIHSPADLEASDSEKVIKHIRSLLAQAVGKNSALNISFNYQSESLNGDFNIVFESDRIISLLEDVLVLSNG